MSEEEKEAIETLKEVASDDFDTLGDDISPKMAQNILNVIDKQQKEIEEKNVAINKMSKDISRQLEEIEKLKFNNHMLKKWNEQLDKNCISKDKIRKFIKDELPDDEIMECCGMYDVNGVRLREELEKLLEENDGDHIPRID